MIVHLLEADLDELARLELDPARALGIGVDALDERSEGSTESLEELRHLYADAVAEMRLLQFSFTTKAGEYTRSRARYDAVEGAMAELQRDVVPELRARLRELCAREQALELRLAERGIEPARVGPLVAPGTTVDTTPKPGEYDERMPALLPLPPRRSLLERLLRSLRRDRSSGRRRPASRRPGTGR
jgi:hypothetical protein